MARQPHPECNFRMGRRMVRERRKAMTTGLLELLDVVGMTDQEKREFLERLGGRNQPVTGGGAVPIQEVQDLPPSSKKTTVLVRPMLCNRGTICTHSGPCHDECGGDHYWHTDGYCLRCEMDEPTFNDEAAMWVKKLKSHIRQELLQCSSVEVRQDVWGCLAYDLEQWRIRSLENEE